MPNGLGILYWHALYLLKLLTVASHWITCNVVEAETMDKGISMATAHEKTWSYSHLADSGHLENPINVCERGGKRPAARIMYREVEWCWRESNRPQKKKGSVDEKPWKYCLKRETLTRTELLDYNCLYSKRPSLKAKKKKRKDNFTINASLDKMITQ